MSLVLWLIATPLRLLGYLLLIAAFLAGANDLYRSVALGEPALVSLGELWFRLSPETLNLAQAGIQRGVHPAVWDPGAQFLLMLPSWLSLFIIAALILALAHLIYRPS